MPSEPRCLVCNDAATRVAVNELNAQGLSIRDIAGRVKRSRSSVHRHIEHSTREKPGASGKRSVGRALSHAGRVAEGRCPTCGLSMTETDPQSLLRRAERLLWLAETIAAQAQRDDDARLALQAVDRARSALETMMRATGLIGGDQQINVTVDARRQVMATLARLDEHDLRALAAGSEPLKHVTDNERLSVKSVPALEGEIGTP
jgi:hypothetical protein